MKKLLLIDGMAAVYRAYYALNKNPRINSKGLNTSAILGFTTTLYDLLRSQQPTHVGVAFDLPKPTFRHEMYAEYKANRDAMPEEIQSGLPWVKKIIEAFRIPILTCEGYEADDVIGTLSHEAEKAGFDEVLMVTPDKDFAQLVTEHVKMYRFARMGRPDSIMGIPEVQEKFGVANCRQVIDLLGLWGDASDNIPGIPGVGEKTAKKLIDQFGSIEEMIAHAEQIKNDKLRRLVQENSEQALFSKQLATIRLDAPIPFDAQALLRETPDLAMLKELTDQLEFRQFARKVFTDLSVSDPSLALQWQSASTAQPAAPQSADQPTLFDLAPAASHAPAVHQQTLTSDVLDNLLGKDIAILIDNQTLILSTDADTVWAAQLSQVDMPRLSALLQHPDSQKLTFDLKKLKNTLSEHSLEVRGSVFDVQLAHYLVDPEVQHTLQFVSSSLLGFEPADAPASAAVLWQLYPLLVAKMRDAHLEQLYFDVELPLVDVLLDIERCGVRIDVQALADLSRQLAAQRADLEQEIFKLAGQTFNIASPRQLGEVLFDKLQITPRPPRTPSGQYSTSEDTLTPLASAHPVVQLILQHRSLSKLIGTYLDPFPKLINPQTGRLHTVYNQTSTATGRLSSSHPNLQNIPIRTPMGRLIRQAFVPSDDQHLLLAADYSQIELRIAASLADDPNLISAFTDGLDIHAATAATIFHVPIAQVSSEQRRLAKSVNFGILYGISAFGLAQQLSIPRSQAAELINDYFTHFPRVRQLVDQMILSARQHGYAETLLHRRRYLPDINSRNAAARSFAERNAVNMPIQGTSADMIKIAMVRIHHQLLSLSLHSRIILQVHDELLLDLYPPEEPLVRHIVANEMKNALPLHNVPLEVSIGVAPNWLQAH